MEQVDDTIRRGCGWDDIRAISSRSASIETTQRAGKARKICAWPDVTRATICLVRSGGSSSGRVGGIVGEPVILADERIGRRGRIVRVSRAARNAINDIRTGKCRAVIRTRLGVRGHNSGAENASENRRLFEPSGIAVIFFHRLEQYKMGGRSTGQLALTIGAAVGVGKLITRAWAAEGRRESNAITAMAARIKRAIFFISSSVGRGSVRCGCVWR